MNKKSTIAHYKHMLAIRKDWAIRGLMAIYKYQTDMEKSYEATDHNGVGFTGTDGQLLTSFANFYSRNNYLSDRQMAYVFKKMPKYAAQLYRIVSGKQS